jgi:hypothetical protein
LDGAGGELIAGIGADAAREIVFDFNGIRSAVLSQERGSEFIGDIGAGTGAVLRAIEPGVWGRTERGKLVTLNGVGRKAGATCRPGPAGWVHRTRWSRPWPTGGNSKIVIGELVHHAQLAGHAVIAGPIGVGRNAVGPRRSAGGAAGRERPAGPTGDAFVKVGDGVPAFAVAHRAAGLKILSDRTR